jgi:hypothetical protein
MGNPGTGNTVNLWLGNVRIFCVSGNKCFDIPTMTLGSMNVYFTKRVKLEQQGTNYSIFTNNGSAGSLVMEIVGDISSAGNEAIRVSGQNTTINFYDSKASSAGGDFVAINGYGAATSRYLSIHDSDFRGSGSQPAVGGSWTSLTGTDSYIERGGTSTYDLNITGIAVVSGLIRLSGAIATLAATSIIRRHHALYIGYDNSGSGLTATDIQGAIDEIISEEIGGVAAFVAVSQVAITFGSPLPSADYRVLSTPDGNVNTWIANKTVSGFTIYASTTFTGNVDWLVKQV